jgi:hypothetical protein
MSIRHPHRSPLQRRPRSRPTAASASTARAAVRRCSGMQLLSPPARLSPPPPGRLPVQSLAAALDAATPAQRITAARAWGDSLARFHQRKGVHGDVSPSTAIALRLAPYRWRVELLPGGSAGSRGGASDLGSELARACQFLRTRPGSAATVRACVRAFCEGYRAAGGPAALPRP